MIGIVDYNAGNITSVERALKFLNSPYIISKNPLDLKDVDKIIFPGVGEASYAMKQLKKTGFDSFLKDFVASKKSMIGICLGSQIVFDYSEEGDVECLGFLKGKIRHFSSLWNEQNIQPLKVPNIGWHNIHFVNGSSKLLNGIQKDSCFYFVHSYVIQPEDSSIIKAYADYGIEVPCVIEKDNITLFQFHPEKSGTCGIKILQNFINDSSLN